MSSDELDSSTTKMNDLDLDLDRVLVRENAVGPHPRHSNVEIPYTGISRLLLENGDELFECDTCSYRNVNIYSVRSHRSRSVSCASNRWRFTTYPEHVVRLVLGTTRWYRDEGHINFLELAARYLNDSGVPTRRGQRWTSDTVGSLVRKESSNFKVRARKPNLDVTTTKRGAVAHRRLTSRRRVARTPQVVGSEVPRSVDPGDPAAHVTDLLRVVRAGLDDLESAVARLTEKVGSEQLRRLRTFDEVRTALLSIIDDERS